LLEKLGACTRSTRFYSRIILYSRELADCPFAYTEDFYQWFGQSRRTGPCKGRAVSGAPGVESSTRAAPQLCGSVPGCTEARQIVEGTHFFFDEARSLGNEVARLTRRYGSPGLPRLRVARLLRHLALARKDGGNNGQLVSLLLFSLLSSGAFRLGFGRLVVLCGPHVSSGSWEPPVVWLRSTLHLLRRSSSCRAQSTCVSSATSCVPLPAPSFDRSGACAKAWTLAHWRTGAHAA